MSDLTGLRATILEQTRQKGELKLQAAKEQHELTYRERHEDLMAAKEASRQRGVDKIINHYQREEQKMFNRERQSLLEAKQSTLTTLFRSALDQMNQWSEQEHIAFLENVLAKYDGQSATLIFGELTGQTLSTDMLAHLTTKYPQITFSDEIIANKGGFILSQGNVDDNYLYDVLVESIRQQQSYRISAQIFNEV